ncbi:hypothetical protein HMPREF9306_01293 [Propionimicrobium lymphophilum ACS-093-V-SCH5]|uniref:Phage head morphogenesis domain-containing protein n=1 Tax=Propionimicrobium lymphophilum ACS-093-V-SCH5 TaxID=883161 RepID=S2WXU6_9ACTN|nr:hypothetical protein [Propionimicrobium lymphophilum]EPD32594.1 hypothetical protein HMPREF9306_01293 [Propionimicrobium lymphophilum ACS-093-V-SCH5]
MDTLQLQRAGSVAASKVANAYNGFLEGNLSFDEFVQFSTNTICKAQLEGQVVGNLAWRSWLEENGLTDFASLFDPLSGFDEEAVRQAILKIMEPKEVEQAAMRLRRLADSQPAFTAQKELSKRIKNEPKLVSGWRRHVDDDGCQLCHWWSREGRVFQPDHGFASHPGCTCYQQPVRNVYTINYQTEKQMIANRRRNRKSRWN